MEEGLGGWAGAVASQTYEYKKDSLVCLVEEGH